MRPVLARCLPLLAVLAGLVGASPARADDPCGGEVYCQALLGDASVAHVWRMDDSFAQYGGYLAALGPAVGTLQFPNNGGVTWGQAGYGFSGASGASRAMGSAGTTTAVYSTSDLPSSLVDLEQSVYGKTRWTWELWVKPTADIAVGEFRRVMAGISNGTSVGWSLEATELDAAQGRLRFRWRSNPYGTGVVTLSAPQTGLRTGAWTHLAISSDGGFMRVYVNGSEVMAFGATGGLSGLRAQFSGGPEGASGNLGYDNAGIVGLYDTIAAFGTNLPQTTIANHYAAR
jgi:hypothetical protein